MAMQVLVKAITASGNIRIVRRWQSRLYCHECGATMRADEWTCRVCNEEPRTIEQVTKGRRVA
ncbi:MAG: hypothetical protein ACREMG_04205 [Gemmatimonadales bacterium]